MAFGLPVDMEKGFQEIHAYVYKETTLNGANIYLSILFEPLSEVFN